MKPGIQQFGMLLSILLLSGCSGMWNEANPDPATAKSVADNQIVAWIPVDQAQSPTVVRAMTLVVLGKAKKATEAALCQGQWVFSGQVDESGVPERTVAPSSLGSYAAWQYRISWNPELPDCSQASGGEYFRALSKNMPRWMIVQSGAEATIYHQGLAVFTGESTNTANQLALLTAAQSGG